MDGGRDADGMTIDDGHVSLASYGYPHIHLSIHSFIHSSMRRCLDIGVVCRVS